MQSQLTDNSKVTVCASVSNALTDTSSRDCHKPKCSYTGANASVKFIRHLHQCTNLCYGKWRNGALSVKSGIASIAFNKLIYNMLALSVYHFIFYNSSACNTTGYYRTKASGNWNNADIGESWTDGLIFSQACAPPGANSTSIIIRSTHVVAVTANTTTAKPTVQTVQHCW